jgi:hypothetical protein
MDAPRRGRYDAAPGPTMDGESRLSGREPAAGWVLPCLVAAALLLIYLPHILSQDLRSQSFIKGDCFYYHAAVVSLLEDGDLVLNNNIGNVSPLNGFLALGHDLDMNRLRPMHPVLMPVVSVPFYAVFGVGGLLLFNLVVILTLFVFVYLLNRRFVGGWIALAVAVLFGSATLFHNYSYNYSPDAFATLLFVSGLYFALQRAHVPSAALLGLSVFAKLPNAPLVGLVCLYLAVDARRTGTRPVARLALFGGVLLLALVPFVVTNHLLYGSPWSVGYHREVTAHGIDNHLDKFHQPLFRGFVRLLLDRDYGLVTTNPVLLLSLGGVAGIRRSPRRSELVLLAMVCLTQLALFAKYDEWNHSHFSNRFLMTAVALASVFAAVAVEPLLRRMHAERRAV